MNHPPRTRFTAACIAMLLAALPLAGCHQRPIDPVTETEEGSLSVLLSTQFGWIDAISGVSPTDVYAVGVNALYHYDGTRWTPVAGFSSAQSVWAAATDDVYVSGYAGSAGSGLFHFDGLSWKVVGPVSYPATITGSDGSGVYVASDKVIVHFDGAAWDTILVSQETLSGTSMHATGGHLFVVHGDSLFHFDGNVIAAEALPGRYAYSVWAASPTDVWVGSCHGIWRNQGMGWVAATLPSASTCMAYALWGTAGGHVYAVGELGQVLHFDGMTWERLDTGTAGYLRSVWAFDDANIFVGGQRGKLLYSDGSGWRTDMDSGPSSIVALWVAAADDIFVSDEWGGVYRCVAGAWAEIPLPVRGDRVNRMSGSAADNVFATTEHWQLARFDGMSWTVAADTAYGVEVWTSDPDNAIVLGTLDEIYRFDGTALRQEATIASRFPAGVWGADRDHAIVVGGGTMTEYRDGVWRDVDVPAGANLRACGGVSRTDVFIAGDRLYHYDGQRLIAQPAPAPLFGAYLSVAARRADDVVANESGASTVHFDGNEWHPVSLRGASDVVWNMSVGLDGTYVLRGYDVLYALQIR